MDTSETESLRERAQWTRWGAQEDCRKRLARGEDTFIQYDLIHACKGNCWRVIPVKNRWCTPCLLEASEKGMY